MGVFVGEPFSADGCLRIWTQDFLQGTNTPHTHTHTHTFLSVNAVTPVVVRHTGNEDRGGRGGLELRLDGAAWLILVNAAHFRWAAKENPEREYSVCQPSPNLTAPAIFPTCWFVHTVLFLDTINTHGWMSPCALIKWSPQSNRAHKPAGFYPLPVGHLLSPGFQVSFVKTRWDKRLVRIDDPWLSSAVPKLKLQHKLAALKRGCGQRRPTWTGVPSFHWLSQKITA